MLSQTSPKLRLRHDIRHARLSPLNLITEQFAISFDLSFVLFLLPYATLISPIASLPESQHWSMLTTQDFTFLFLSQRLCVADPEATCLCYVGPPVQSSLILPSALLLLQINILRVPPTSPFLLPPAQRESHNPCRSTSLRPLWVFFIF